MREFLVSVKYIAIHVAGEKRAFLCQIFLPCFLSILMNMKLENRQPLWKDSDRSLNFCGIWYTTCFLWITQAKRYLPGRFFLDVSCFFFIPLFHHNPTPRVGLSIGPSVLLLSPVVRSLFKLFSLSLSSHFFLKCSLMRFLFKLILFGRFHQNFLTREIYFEMILVAKLLFKMFSFSQKVVKIFSLVTFLFKGLAAGKIGFPGQTASSGRTFISIINFIHRHRQHCHHAINKLLDLDLWIEYVIPANVIPTLLLI